MSGEPKRINGPGETPPPITTVGGRQIQQGTNPETRPTSDGFGTVPPARLTTTTVPPAPPVLEQVLARVDAIDTFGERFGLSRGARANLIQEVDKRHPLT